jgi:hypothetical protein
MQPAEAFFYIFLLPLLMDSAVRVDWFVFLKIMGVRAAVRCLRMPTAPLL